MRLNAAFSTLAGTDAEHGRTAWQLLQELEYQLTQYTAASRVPPANLLVLTQLWGKIHAHWTAGTADGSVARTLPNYETFWSRYVAATRGVRNLAENGTVGRRTQANATINGLAGFAATGPVVGRAAMKLTMEQSMLLHETGYGWAMPPTGAASRRFYWRQARWLASQFVAAGADPAEVRRYIQQGINDARSAGQATTRIPGRPGMHGLSATYKVNADGVAVQLSMRELGLLQRGLAMRIQQKAALVPSYTKDSVVRVVLARDIKELRQLASELHDARDTLQRS